MHKDTNVFKISKMLENIRETSNVLILPISFHILLSCSLKSSSFHPFPTSPGSSLTIREEQQDNWANSLSSAIK